MAVISSTFLAPALAASTFLTGRKVELSISNQDCIIRSALPVSVRAESGGEVAVSRRAALVGLSAAALAVSTGNASAVQNNQVAGRIPGLSEPDSNGVRTYRRPDGKSGGHGVGWSPMTPYSFKVPQDWEEVPVSIADLGGTEIDLRFQNPQEGNISVIVAPVLRFSSTIGDNATIEAVGTPDKVISAFGPEITGQNVEGKVKSMDVKSYDGRTYYQFELDGPHLLVAATAAGNRLYLMSVSANGRQWKKYAPVLKEIVESFRVA